MSLINKYRPTDYEHVVGQAAAVKQLRNMLSKKLTQAIMLSGPSGTGKTTLARIAAKHNLQCGPADIHDFDAASNTGVDDVRRIQELMRFRPLGGSARRAVIIDEAHRLSGNAWDALLKVTEEPPAHLYWFLCTTNPAKVPATIKTRFSNVQLKAVTITDLEKLGDRVLTAEGIEMDDAVFMLAVNNANGSPRQLLNNLGAVAAAANRKEAAELLTGVGETVPEMIELARLLAKPGKPLIKDCMALVKAIEGNYEGARIVIFNYLSKVAEGGNEKFAPLLGWRMRQFATPYRTGEDRALLICSVHDSLYGLG